MQLLHKYKYVLLFLFSLGVFGVIAILLRTFMGNLDENDHLTVAYLMTKDLHLYKDIFSHHFPFPYYWTYIFTFLWSDSSPARTISIFRLSLTLLQFGIFVLVFFSLEKNRTKLLFSLWIILFSLFYAIYQGNLILSESFTAVFIAGYIWILFPILLKWETINLKKAFILIILAAFAFWTQPLLVGLFIIPFLLKLKKREYLYVFILSFLLIITPVLYLTMNNQLADFINQAIWFNYNIYPHLFFQFILPNSTYPPILTTMILFIQNEFKLFTSIHNWLQGFQFLSHIAVYYLLYVLMKKKLFFNAGIFALIILFSRIREIKVTPGVPFEFGIYPFLIIASTCCVIMIYHLYSYKKIWGALLIIILLFTALLPLKPIFLQSLDKEYNYHVFWSPKQDTGQLIQQLTEPTEQILIYPHDVDLYYFAQRQPIDRFLYWYLWIDAVDYYKHERIQALQKKPPIIYVGNVSHKNDRDYYIRFFPNLTEGYILIKKDGKSTGIWLREDLSERTKIL